MTAIKEFLSYFQKIDPPFIISEESIMAFSRSNKPLPQELINLVFASIDPYFDENADVEYIPCLQLHVSEHFITIVYLRTALLKYEFYLLTLDKAGRKIDQKLIAGLISDNQRVVQMAASFDENACIHIAGATSLSELDTDFGQYTKAVELEIREDGTFMMMEE